MELAIQRALFLHLFTYYVLSTFVFGVQSGIVRSEAEDLELEKQLKLINKPAVEIIETIDGDTYGCVDFYKQPAFDHPALKNHSYRFEPNSYPKTRPNDSNIVDTLFGSLWKNGKGCPNGTVPIRRYTKDELVEVNSITQAYDDSDELIKNDFVRHFAVTRYQENKGKIIKGAGMVASIHNPTVSRYQLSSSRMVIKNNEDRIHVGWTVSPNLYKDTKTRLYIYTKTAAFKCFNQICPGFVIQSQVIPLGSVFREVSKPGSIVQTRFFIKKGTTTDYWLLGVGTPTTMITIGFWPSRIFRSLKGAANYVEWGGITVSPKGVPSPPMGFGTFPPPRGDFSHAAYCSNLLAVNENDLTNDASFTQKYADNPKGYNVVVHSPLGTFGEHMFYGGPGKLT